MRRFIPAAAALMIGAAASLTSASAQTSSGIVMAAYGGGNGETWREMVGKPFAQATAIPVQIADLPNTEAALRASAGKPLYNVAWVASSQAATLYNDGIIETLDDGDFPELKNVPDRFLIRAPNGKLIGIPVQFQYYAIAYNTREAKASDFPSWLSLGEPRWKGKLAQGQPFSAASYDLVMYAAIAGGSAARLEPGVPAFREFTRNTMTILGSFAQGNTLLSRGEIAATPFFSARVRALKKEGAPVDITIPREGAMLLPYMLVVPKGANNKADIVKFLQYSSEPTAQVRMYDYSGYIPFNLRAKLDDKQLAELGMPVEDLEKRLYQADVWALANTMKASVALVEKMQSEH